MSEAIKILHEAEDALASCYEVNDYPGDGSSRQDAALRSVRDCIASLERAEAPAGVVVKKLEWQPHGAGKSIRADAIGLRYYVYWNGDDGLWHAFTEGYLPEIFGQFGSKAEAQAAVEAAHDTRIRSVASAPAPAWGVTEAMVEAKSPTDWYNFLYDYADETAAIPRDNAAKLSRDLAARDKRLFSAALAKGAGWPIGAHVTCKFDGFTGEVIGHYRRKDGYEGAVVQLDGARVVHVYGVGNLVGNLVAAPLPASPDQGQS